jgi:hypothetical protein
VHFFISKKTPGCARTSPVLFNDPSTPSGGGWVGQAPPITRGPSRVASTMRALCIYFLWKITCPRRLFHTVWLLDTWEYKTGTWNRNLSNMISVVKTELLSTLINLSFVTRTTDTQWRHKSKTIWKIGPMWQTKYASAVPKNLGLNFRPFSEDCFLSGRP